MVNANPSVNPADNDSMVGMFRQVLGKFLQNIDDCIPARVIAFDRNSNRAQVQPLIQMVKKIFLGFYKNKTWQIQDYLAD
jgi:hypothetical protein